MVYTGLGSTVEKLTCLLDLDWSITTNWDSRTWCFIKKNSADEGPGIMPGPALKAHTTR
jgi:hypothetical protein